MPPVRASPMPRAWRRCGRAGTRWRMIDCGRVIGCGTVVSGEPCDVGVSRVTSGVVGDVGGSRVASGIAVRREFYHINPISLRQPTNTDSRFNGEPQPDHQAR